jgi:hypothetical protein
MHDDDQGRHVGPCNPGRRKPSCTNRIVARRKQTCHGYVSLGQGLTKTGSIELLVALEADYPGHPFFQGKEKAREWSDKLCTREFYGSLKPNVHEACFAKFSEGLTEFAETMVGPYFHGDHLSIIDVVVFPFLYRAFSLKIFEYHRQHSVHGAPYSQKLGQWVNRCLQLPAIQKTLPDDVDPLTGFSQKLFDVYHVYATGVGLKSVLASELGATSVPVSSL